MNPFYYHIFQKLPNHMITYGYILVQVHVTCNTPKYENSIAARSSAIEYIHCCFKRVKIVAIRINVLNKYL